jgi:peptidyl-tRNA hydrolase
VAEESGMKNSYEKIDNSAFASNAFGIAEEGSNKAVKKFRSLEDTHRAEKEKCGSTSLLVPV